MLKKLLELGKSAKAFAGSTLGGLIELDGDIAYLTNSKRSSVYKLKFPSHIGSGVFYSGEIPSEANKVELRDEKVLVELKKGGVIQRLFVPCKRPISETVNKILDKYRTTCDIRVEQEWLGNIRPDFLFLSMSVKNNKLITNQKRSDGTVEFENEFPLNKGLVEKEYPNTGGIAIFSSDLFLLKPFVNEIFISLNENTPLYLSTKTIFGSDLEGVISNLRYE
ncbi:hypothetical protein KJ925_05125 [Patescibacteria group bacterium]|nr:hypothetical protein [Patescibacteria group bacterium]